MNERRDALNGKEKKGKEQKGRITERITERITKAHCLTVCQKAFNFFEFENHIQKNRDSREI